MKKINIVLNQSVMDKINKYNIIKLITLVS